jgi:uncharacterized phage-associated protein
MNNIHTICDYVIYKLKSHSSQVSFLDNLKLQKLLYYIQAWSLAFYGKKTFDGKFQAWIHGPVNREIFDRFKDTKALYTEMEFTDIRDLSALSSISESDKIHLDNIITHYSGLSGTQLERMTHMEEPWIKARNGYGSYDRCEVEIDEAVMQKYYQSLLEKK